MTYSSYLYNVQNLLLVKKKKKKKKKEKKRKEFFYIIVTILCLLFDLCMQRVGDLKNVFLLFELRWRY